MSGVFLSKKFATTITARFPQIQSVEELAQALNWIEKNDPELDVARKPLDANYLLFLARTKEKRYKHFYINKKSGKKREIKTPDEHLKRVQRLLNCLMQLIFEPKAHYCSNGFLYGRDIVRNARPHVNKTFLLNCDLKDFFPSINFRRVKTVLGLAPFNFVDEKEHLAFLIANLCTYQNELPQGAPTSPLLSNVVTQKLDRKLNKYCSFRNIKYSRYADDLSFSSNRQIFNTEFLEELNNIVTSENFKLNEEKTRIKSDMDRQQVTGLIVNEKINIKREYIQKVRAMLNNWEKGGIYYAQLKFREHQGKSAKNFKETLNGYISFIGNIRGKEDNLFKKIQQQNSMLRNRIDYSFIANASVKEKLESDNIKMEKILLDKIHVTEDKFISFCTAAFHQIENLLNYYYWRRFQDITELLEFLLNNNPNFKKSYKNIEKAKEKFKKIRDLSISSLVYVFEKQFYIDNKIGYYDRRVSKLREIRNDDSHRCSVIEFDKTKILNDYVTLQEKKSRKLKEEKTYLELSKSDIELEYKFHLIEFLEQKDYYFVRKIIKEIAHTIKIDLISINPLTQI